jgi:hypothetical protein
LRAAGRDPHHVVADALELGAAFGADADDRALARADFLDVGDVFLQHAVFRRDEDARHFGRDERDDAVLQLALA